MKINDFRGELTDISAEKEALEVITACTPCTTHPDMPERNVWMRNQKKKKQKDSRYRQDTHTLTMFFLTTKYANELAASGSL